MRQLIRQTIAELMPGGLIVPGSLNVHVSQSDDCLVITLRTGPEPARPDLQAAVVECLFAVQEPC